MERKRTLLDLLVVETCLLAVSSKFLVIPGFGKRIGDLWKSSASFLRETASIDFLVFWTSSLRFSIVFAISSESKLSRYCAYWSCLFSCSKNLIFKFDY